MSYLKRHAAWVLVMGLSLSAAVQASEQLAAYYGCINCHGANRRGDAPDLDRLAQQMAGYKGDDAALTDGGK
jgi:cytochrome c551/c552